MRSLLRYRPDCQVSSSFSEIRSSGYSGSTQTTWTFDAGGRILSSLDELNYGSASTVSNEVQTTCR